MEKSKTLESAINPLMTSARLKATRKLRLYGPSNNFWKKAMDPALYLIACLTAETGLLLAYRLPHGAGNAGRVVFFLAMGGMSGAIFILGLPSLVSSLWWSILR